MRMIDSSLYLTYTELSVYGFSESFLWKACNEHRNGSRKSYANTPDPDDARICLVQYNSIPSQTRQDKGMPEESELIASQVIPSLIQRSHEVLDFYKAPNLPQAIRDHASEFQTAVAYLDWVAPASLTFARSYGFEGVDPLYTAVIRLMLAEKLSIWNITNLDRFKRKLSPFKKWSKNPSEITRKQALNSLVSKQFGKKNAAKVLANDPQTEEMQSAIVIIYSDPIKFTINETYIKYLEKAAQQFQLYQHTKGKEGWDKRCFITEQTVANFLHREEIQQVWFAPRHGDKVAKDVYERNTKRLPASFSNAKWVMDGTPLHRYFQSEDSVFNRVHVYFILDEASWYVLGVGISLIGETSGQVLQALRAASQRVGIILGDEKLYVPFEVQTDNSSANQSFQVKEAIRLMGATHRPAGVGNSKSKIVEPFNKHFFARWMKFRKGFTGSMGMSTKLDNKINQEVLTKAVVKKELPDLLQTLNELQEDVQHWNNDRTWNNAGVPEQDRKSPFEKFKASLQTTADRQKTISEHLGVEAFYYMPTRAKQVKDVSGSKRKMKTIHIPQEYKYTNSGITVERQNPFDGKKIKINLDVPDPDFNSRYISSKFTLKIEPLNYDHAYLFKDGKPVLDQEGKWIKAINRELFHSAMADHTEGEAKRLAEHEQIKKDQKALTVSRFELHALRAKKLGLEVGKIENPRLFGQKEVTDGLKIAASEQLVNPNRYHLEKDQEHEHEELEIPTEEKDSPSFNRFAL